MTRQRRNVVALAVAGVVAATVAAEVSRDAAGIETAAARAELRAISSRLDGPHSTILIESSEPVAYVTSQPDPLTVLVDLRNVKAGQLPPGILGPLPPVANVNVEEAVAGDGAPLARVRVGLAHQAKYRVRSARNVIFVEVDRAVVAAGAKDASAESVAPDPPAIPERDRRKRRHPRRACGTAPPHDRDADTGPSGHVHAGASQRTASAAASRAGRAAGHTASDRTGRIEIHRAHDHAGYAGRRPARRAPHVLRHQRTEHRDRPVDHGNGGRAAPRRAVGSGARHHPQGEQARVRGGRHRRPHRAARGAAAGRRRTPQADRREGSRR